MSQQTTPPARRGDGERVRFCLACGAVVPFDQATCSACGHVETGLPGSPGEPVVACRSCLEFLPASLLFCPACGAEITPPAAPPAREAMTPVAASAGPIPLLCASLSLLAPLLALFAIGELVLDALPGFRPAG